MEYIDEASIQEKATFCEVVIPIHVFHHQLKNTYSMESFAGVGALFENGSGTKGNENAAAVCGA